MTDVTKQPCQFCDRPRDADGGITHVGDCEGLQYSEMNKLQERILRDERDSLLLKLDRIMSRLIERDDGYDRCVICRHQTHMGQEIPHDTDCPLYGDPGAQK